MSNKNRREEFIKIGEKHCFKCEYFYEGCICGFEISMDDEKDTMEDVMERRKNVCTLDKEMLNK